MLAALTALAFAAASPSVPSGAIRATVKVKVNGQPKAEAAGVVVFVADQPLAVAKTVAAEMPQQSLQFSPQVLVVPVGTEVAFPNHDTVEHNVFSRSPHATFDLGRFGHGGSKSHRFEEAGVIDVYCNVHSSMVGHVVVVPGPWGQSGPDGTLTIEGVTPGHHKVVIWDRLGAPSVMRAEVDVPATGIGTLAIDLVELEAEPPHSNKFGGAYHTTNY